MYASGSGMSPLDSLLFGGGFQTVFFLIFALVIGGLILVLISGIRQWHKNNGSPRLTVNAAVVSRRTRISGGSGDRMEFSVSGQEYGLLAEGDTGQLTFQGTRFLGFERQ